MDVRCDKCGTEYEFDDARVGDNGVTVKCTNCQHVFRVKRPQAAVSSMPSSSNAPREWLVKKPDGQMIAFRELTTLQKWIVEGRISRDDEISRNGETWKRLGNIAELEPFFSVFERARALNDLMATGAIGDRPLMVNGSEILATMSPLSSIVAASSPLPDRGDDMMPARRTSEAPPRRSASVITRAIPARVDRTRGPSMATRRPDLPGFEDLPGAAANGAAGAGALAGESSTERSIPTMSRAATTPTEAVPRVALARGSSGGPSALNGRPSREPTLGLEARTGPLVPPPGLAALAARPSGGTGLLGPGALSDVGELSPKRTTTAEAEGIVDGFAKKRRRRTATLFLAVFMALGLGGGAALATLGPEENPLRKLAQQIGLLPPPPPKGPDKGSELVEAARRAHDLDRLDAFAEAEAHYRSALALPGADVPTLSADLALVLTTWADALRTQAARDDARAAANPPPADAGALTAGAEAARSQASAQMKKAFELLRSAYDKDPRGLAPSRALADYYRVQRDESGRFAQLLAQARDAAQAAGTTDAAVSYVEAAQLARDPERASAADLDRAVKLLDDALTVRPTLVRARVLLARIALARGQVPVARAELTRALEASPEHAEATLVLAMTGSATGAAAGSAVAAAVPGAAVAPAGGAAEAVVAATPAPSASPIASAAPSASAPPVAPAVPTPAASAAPSAPASVAPVASASARPAAPPAAATDAPKSHDAYVKNGDRLRERGEAWEALLSYEKASVVRPYSGRAYAGMGWSYLDLAKPEAALHQFRKAIAVEPGYPEGHLGHADAYRALGNADKALGSYKRYLELRSTGAGAESARRAIASLEGSPADSGAAAGGETTPDPE